MVRGTGAVVGAEQRAQAAGEIMFEGGKNRTAFVLHTGFFSGREISFSNQRRAIELVKGLSTSPVGSS